ncbi:MAG: DUF4340 domain-containing protein [Anaerolineae bacterium]|nr:DUF4340 domain-containing protein [Anaerolineae bacterium]
MSWRSTAILFVIFLVVAAAVLLLQPGDADEAGATPGAAAEFVEVSDLFGGLTVDDVVRVEIVREEPPDQALFEQGEGNLWVQTVPTTTQVLSTTLTNQVTGLLNMRARRSFSAEGGDLAPYGLDEPQATIVVAARREGQTVRYELALGDLTPTGTAYYVLRRGDPRVHLLSTTPLDGLLRLLDTVPLLPTPTP